MNPSIKFDDDSWRPQLELLAEGVSFDLPPLKRNVQFGVMLWWPADRDAFEWIHPDDHEIVDKLVPSNRILQRIDIADSDYSQFVYGEYSFRVRPNIWFEVNCEPFEIGDLVETRSQMGRRKPITARITDVLWNTKQQIAQFRLSQNGHTLTKLFSANEFQIVATLNAAKDWRTIQLMEKAKAF